MKKLSPRVWLTLVLVGLVGQFAWTIENMYFNVYLYNTISTDPGYISAMVGWSAAAATLTTLLMGALSDRVGKRKLFICGGYLLWGLSTAAFGLVTVENAAKLFPAAAATAAAAVMIVVLDCVMTFFGSTANDAAFNAYVTDITDNSNRGRAESVLAILPLISMLIIFGAFDGLTQPEGCGRKSPEDIARRDERLCALPDLLCRLKHQPHLARSSSRCRDWSRA